MFHCPNRGEPQKNKNPISLLKKWDFDVQAPYPPKDLWLIEIWQGQAFKVNIIKLEENVKPRLQKKPVVWIAAWQGHLFHIY